MEDKTTITKEELKKRKKAKREKKRQLQKKVDRLILEKAEIKRVGEKLTKKEICNIYGFNYTFYMNIIGGRNLPSQKMVKLLQKYLDTPTEEVYKMVFKSRYAETSFNNTLEIDLDEFDKNIEINKSNNNIIINEDEINVLRNSIIEQQLNRKDTDETETE